MRNLIAVGDIHGCAKQLTEILNQAKQYPHHQLVFLGDYIDRGPESDSVCKALMEINGIFLKGNHEEMLLKRAIANPEKLNDLLAIASISKTSFEWIKKKLLYVYYSDDVIFVHAGLDINKKLSEQTEYDYLWTRQSGDYFKLTNKKVIHGHSVVPEPEMQGNRININTGCGSGGYLTALVLPEMKFLKSSTSSGSEYNWERIRKELDEELEELVSIDNYA